VSSDKDKIKNSKRRQKDQDAVSKQVKIAKAYGFPTGPEHRLAKVHATTCGNSNCVMCGNPRKFFNEPTQQEKRLFQDIDQPNDKHSNGIPPKQDD
jgi:hypothetical protein